MFLFSLLTLHWFIYFFSICALHRRNSNLFQSSNLNSLRNNTISEKSKSIMVFQNVDFSVVHSHAISKYWIKLHFFVYVPLVSPHAWIMRVCNHGENYLFKCTYWRKSLMWRRMVGWKNYSQKLSPWPEFDPGRSWVLRLTQIRSAFHPSEVGKMNAQSW